jgi:hypothetical protein
MSQFFSTLFPVPPVLVPILQSIGTVWGYTWWIVLPLVTGMIFWETYKLYLHVRFLQSINWVVLEIKVPKNVLKTPKAMEQIFAAAHAPFSYGYNWYQKYVQGRQEDFFSFELVGRNGETHFYLRTPRQYQDMMESAIYGQFPEAEVVEVEDYLHSMPKVLPNRDLDVAGFEEVFAKPDPYPIRTYLSFEDQVEERRVDTMGALLESLSKMKGDQQFWYQLVIVPAGFELPEEGEKIMNKLLGIEEKHEKKPSIFPDFDLGITLGEALRGPFEHPGAAKDKHDQKTERQQRFLVSPANKEAAEAIQKKVGKFAFETTMRFLFISRHDEVPSADKNVMLGHSYVRQFNSHDLNQLRPYKDTTTASYAVHGLFKKTRVRLRKRILYERYHHLSHLGKAPLLNIEELATVFHFPTTPVATSELEKVESRKGTPPASLPMVE